MEIKPIRSEADYQAALMEIDNLLDGEPDSLEADRLKVISSLVWLYEEAHHTIPAPDPIEALEYYLESRGLKRQALEPYIGRTNRVSEIMNRRRRLTLEMIRKLEAGTGIPATVLIQPYDLVEQDLTAVRSVQHTFVAAD